MKKTIGILLAFLIVVNLCACGKDEPISTQCSHQYTEKVTKEATCVETGTKTFTCEKCEDTYSEVIEKISHSYTQGKCTVCAEAQPDYKALTDCGWRTAGLIASGGELDVITLRVSGEEPSVSAGFYEPIDKFDKDLQDELLQNPEELYEFQGKKYSSMGFGAWRPLSYEENGDTVVVSILEDVAIGTITMVRSGADQYTVTEITGRIIDSTVTSCISVGSIFTAVITE